jgi:hypothetical protein
MMELAPIRRQSADGVQSNRRASGNLGKFGDNSHSHPAKARLGDDPTVTVIGRSSIYHIDGARSD